MNVSGKRTLVQLTFIVILLLFALLLHTPKASAAYDEGRIIDNATLLNARSMSKEDIQNFLVARGGGLKNMSFVLQCYGPSSKERQLYAAVGAACDTSMPASHIIYYSAQVYGINPKAILATMQKEQSLVTAPNPTSWQLNQAMGYGCPTTGNCSGNSTFSYQIDSGTWVLRYHYERANGNLNWWHASSSWTCGTEKNFYKPNLYPRQHVRFYDGNGTHYKTIYIHNAATSSFYCYTPHAYNNPQGLYGRAAYGTTGMYYSGSYNFVYFYELWFGSTLAYIHNGVDYSGVFDADYYLNANHDVRQATGDNSAAAFSHFVSAGMREGRQGISDFNVYAYRNGNSDLRWAYGTDLSSYYWHFTTIGRVEGRTAIGNINLQPVSVLGGVNYSNIYDYTTYLTNNPDVRNKYINDDTGALWHFVTNGMAEGRTAKAGFNVLSYAGRYPDLRSAFGGSLRPYYIHYLNTGINEGRVATGDYLAGTTILGGINYSDIYNWDYYARNNPDVKRTFGLNDTAALQHFVSSGMTESRQGNQEFNVHTYKSLNMDLQQAYGNSLRLYYIHYMNTGKAEGRRGV